MSVRSGSADVRSLDLWWRVAAVVAASLASALAAPVWLATPLAGIAVFAAIQCLVRHRRRGWPDAMAVSAAALLIALVLIGLVLQLIPAGFARIPWAVGVGLVALAAVLWGASRPATRPERINVDRRSLLRPAGWYVGAAALVTIALLISVHSANVTSHPPLQLSAVGAGGSRDIVVTAGTHSTDGDRYELVTRVGTRSSTLAGPFEVAAGHSVSYRISEVPGVRMTVLLRAAGTTHTLRSLVLQQPSSGGAG